MSEWSPNASGGWPFNERCGTSANPARYRSPQRPQSVSQATAATSSTLVEMPQALQESRRPAPPSSLLTLQEYSANEPLAFLRAQRTPAVGASLQMLEGGFDVLRAEQVLCRELSDQRVSQPKGALAFECQHLPSYLWILSRRGAKDMPIGGSPVLGRIFRVRGRFQR